MKYTYLGHAAFKVESDGKTVFIDPWLNGPTSPMKVDEVDNADIVLVTHDHGDHGYAEALNICRKTGAYFVAINELGIKAKEAGLSNVHTLNIGGSVDIDSITVTLLQAFHSCGVGAPTGFIVKFPSGSFYHAGDTGIFASMKLFGELYTPDVVLLPIGSYYVMDELQAAKAVELLKPKAVIPMHYDTFPVITADTNKFSQLVSQKSPRVRVEILKPGESRELSF